MPAWLATAAAFALGGLLAWQARPRLGVWQVRRAFDRAAQAASDALVRYVPGDLAAHLDERYDDADPRARLDVFHPAEGNGPLPAVVWIHGGAWVAGCKAQGANYASILAGGGFAVAAVDHALAPSALHPAPLRQLNAALAYLVRHARRLRIDPQRLVLAGDRGGAHIAAQLATVITSPAYAALLGVAPAIAPAQLAGMLLYGGLYDLRHLDLEGRAGGLLRTALAAYAGSRRFADDPHFAPAGVLEYVTCDFPPAFISAGNADPLLAQSEAFAARLRRLGVRVTTMFFPAVTRPPLGAGYQFDLDGEAGVRALHASSQYLSRLSGPRRLVRNAHDATA